MNAAAVRTGAQRHASAEACDATCQARSAMDVVGGGPLFTSAPCAAAGGLLQFPVG